jgi:hypothetical protein
MIYYEYVDHPYFYFLYFVFILFVNIYKVHVDYLPQLLSYFYKI